MAAFVSLLTLAKPVSSQTWTQNQCADYELVFRDLFGRRIPIGGHSQRWVW